MALSLITDRTPSDAAYYKGQIDKINKKGWASLTIAEQTEWLTANLKGGYWYTDLNRVGAAMSYVAGLIKGYGYAVTVSPVTNWTVNSIFTADDAATYLANVAAIKAAFYVTNAIPAVMNSMSPDDANNIEKLLLEIEDHLTQMAAAFRYCGELICGED